MKVATLTIVAAGCFLFVFCSLFELLNEFGNLKRTPIDLYTVLFFIVILVFALVVLIGIYLNQKWALYLFLSLMFLVTITYLNVWFEAAKRLYWFDYCVFFCISGVFISVLYVLSKIKTKQIFDEEDFSV